ncbi:hypothetical protein RB10518 [Rhodopirellula baltica SH 1]|uniref:Uncharacterized protein n=1 Tax=Rhodopirellula baltica (strain DSM 10527 / NCIMB 13988 / SH1) TaxID=243090 RepID=Q7UEW2_RHOBA|nr:hypothetical protein RB10518 [Rhodopirellula baltica SH 1]
MRLLQSLHSIELASHPHDISPDQGERVSPSSFSFWAQVRVLNMTLAQLRSPLTIRLKESKTRCSPEMTNKVDMLGP